MRAAVQNRRTGLRNSFFRFREINQTAATDVISNILLSPDLGGHVPIGIFPQFKELLIRLEPSPNHPSAQGRGQA
jgi:hypothetical protein